MSWRCLGAQVLQWVAVIFCLILVAFEILLLECIMVENFLAEVPHSLPETLPRHFLLVAEVPHTSSRVISCNLG